MYANTKSFWYYIDIKYNKNSRIQKDSHEVTLFDKYEKKQVSLKVMNKAVV